MLACRQVGKQPLLSPPATLPDASVDRAPLTADPNVQGLRYFIVQSVCDADGHLVAFLVFGHSDRIPFSDRQPWTALCDTLQIIMYTTVAASRLPEMITFAEHARLARSAADAIILLSKLGLSVLFGELCPLPLSATTAASNVRRRRHIPC